MAKRLRLIAALGAAMLAVIALALLAHRSTSRTALDKYKAELRAKGEKINFAELGFPRPPEDSAGMVQLTNAVGQMQFPSFISSQINFIAPGRAEVSWRLPETRFKNDGGPDTNWLTWTELERRLERVQQPLANIRSAVERPMRWSLYDPANFSALRPLPLRPMLTAARWLGADAIDALHTGDRERAAKDLHAVAQLTEFGKEDPTEIAHLNRFVITRIGLELAWETLHDTEWTESDLAAMQQAWARLDLLKALEDTYLVERAGGEVSFAEIRRVESRDRYQKFPPHSDASAAVEQLKTRFAWFAWNLNAAADELFFLRYCQGVLDSIRDIERQKPWPAVRAEQDTLLADLNWRMTQSTGLREFKHRVSAVVIQTNFTQVTRNVVRTETQRRLTITAIALKRYQLRHHHLPATLQELTPDLLAAVPIDPMSGQPLLFRLNPDGTFLLYSTGEDGRDDGGDPTPTQPTTQYDFWSGRDAVWPVPNR